MCYRLAVAQLWRLFLCRSTADIGDPSAVQAARARSLSGSESSLLCEALFAVPMDCGKIAPKAQPQFLSAFVSS